MELENSAPEIKPLFIYLGPEISYALKQGWKDKDKWLYYTNTSWIEQVTEAALQAACNNMLTKFWIITTFLNQNSSLLLTEQQHFYFQRHFKAVCFWNTPEVNASEALTHTAAKLAFLKVLNITRVKTIFCVKIIHVYVPLRVIFTLSFNFNSKICKFFK